MSAAPATHSDEWHDLRLRRLGASEIAIAAGISPYGSRWSLYAEKSGLVPPDAFEQTEAMETGLILEGILADQFERQSGLHVIARQLMVTHPEHPWCGATLDGLAVESPSSGIGAALGPVQLKHTDDRPWRDEPPDHMVAQVLWEEFVTASETGWLFALHRGGAFRAYQVPRDEAAIAALFEAGRAFWHDHVLAGIPPALDGSEATTEALKRAYATGGGEAVDLDDLAEVLATRRHRAAQMKAMKADLAALDNELRAALGDAEVGLVGGEPVVTLTGIPASTYTVERKASRRLDVRHPCDVCSRPLRPQDEEKHMTKHTTETKEA